MARAEFPARIFEILPLRCSLCGGEMRIIAFVTDEPAIHSILTYLGEPATPVRTAPARGPPLWGQTAQSHWDPPEHPRPSTSSTSA